MVLLVASLAAACNAEPGSAGASNVSDGATMSDAVATRPTPTRISASTGGALTLSGPADKAARAAVVAEAGRQGMIDVDVAPSQSFVVTEGRQKVATLLTGRGTMPGAVNAGCFVAVRQADDTALIPTLGYGNYEAETCGGPLAVGLLASGTTVRIGLIFRSYSQDAAETTPMVIEWDRSTNTLLIDEASSNRAFDSGATSIAAMRRLVR